MRWILAIAVVIAGPAVGDVLGLNDYDAMFADPANAISQLEDGSRVLALPHDVQVMETSGSYTSLDAGPAGAVGCFVKILSQIAAYQEGCEAPFDADLMSNHAAYLDQVLAFYAENTAPVSNADAVRARYEALVAASIPNAQQYCGQTGGITDFMLGVLSPKTAEVVDKMLATPRLPVDNPCL